MTAGAIYGGGAGFIAVGFGFSNGLHTKATGRPTYNWL
jgi:hypothetical protein